MKDIPNKKLIILSIVLYTINFVTDTQILFLQKYLTITAINVAKFTTIHMTPKMAEKHLK